MQKSIEQVQILADQYHQSFQSVVLATLTTEKEPYTSYATFLKWNGKFYMLISKIAKHYANLVENPIASLIMVEDESAVENIFFRRRLSYLVDVELEVKDAKIKEEFISRFGKFAEKLFTMNYILVESTIKNGTFIIGPGQAYCIDKKGAVISPMPLPSMKSSK